MPYSKYAPDGVGKIIDIVDHESEKSPGYIKIKMLSDQDSNPDLLIPSTDWKKIFYVEKLDKPSILRYNKDGDIVSIGDKVIIKYLDIPSSSSSLVGPLAIIKDTFEEELKNVLPVAAYEESEIVLQQGQIRPYTFKLGASEFFIPPSTIHVDRLNNVEKLPVIRSKTSIKKNLGRGDTRISLRIFFNGPEQINDEQNGLRALIAQFSKTPFLPVFNNYLNQTHGIDAVCLHDLSISTLPNFPNTIVASITLFEFNYQALMPGAIGFHLDWELFEWHYKRNLITGENPKLKPIPLNFAERSSRLSFEYLPMTEVANLQRDKVLANMQGINKKIIDAHKEIKVAIEDTQRMENVLELVDKMKEESPLESEIKFENNSFLIFKRPKEFTSQNIRDSDLAILRNDKDGVIEEDFDFIVLIQRNYNVQKYLGDTSFRIIKINSNNQEEYVEDGRTFFISRKSHPIYGRVSPDLILVMKNGQWTEKSQEAIKTMHRFVEDAKAFSNSDLYKKSMGAEDLLLNKFEPWLGLEDIVISGIQISKQNNFARLPIESQELPVFQFVGSQDAFIKIEMQTRSEEALQSLRELYELSNAQARNYAYNMNTGFLKLNNDLVRLFGVEYVMFESLSAITVPGFPGLFSIEATLVDFDALQSRIERSQSIRKENENYVVKSVYSDEDGLDNPGKGTSNIDNRQQYLEWLDIQNLTRFIDLYPDLDLPTYYEIPEELQERVYYNGGVFVDPDFYIKRDPTFIDELASLINNQSGVDVLLRDEFKQEVVLNSREHIDSLAEDSGEIQVIQNDLSLDPKELDTSKIRPKIVQTDNSAQGSIYQEQSRNYEMINLGDVVDWVNATYNSPYLKKYPLTNEIATILAVSESSLRHFTGNGIKHNSYALAGGIIDVWGLMQISAVFYASDTAEEYGNAYEAKRINPKGYTAKEIKNNPRANLEVGLMLLADRFHQIMKNPTTAEKYDKQMRAYPLVYSGIREVLPSDIPMEWIAAMLKYKGYTPDKISGHVFEILRKETISTYMVYPYVFGKFDQKYFKNQKFYSMSSENRMIAESQFNSLYKPEVVPTQEVANREQSLPTNHEYALAAKNSWYDSMRYSNKGRMLRAFPTFHMFIVDEGQWIRWTRMWDNFYGIRSVHEITINRSRKRAADTAMITMSNMYRYIEDTVDTTKEEVLNFKEASTRFWRELWPRVDEQTEFERSISIGRLRLSPGARVQIKLGYGNNLQEIPPLFNGTITEIEVGEIINILAQGDGIELTNTLDFKEDYTPGHFGLGAEPQNLLKRLLMYGSDDVTWEVVKQTIGQKYWGSRSSKNPVVHFGDPTFTLLWKSGEELTQNIYPGNGSGKPEWGDAWSWATEDELNIEINMYQKSIWDVAQVLAAAIPNYIVAVHPFGCRSTLYYGKPHWDLAFDYEIFKGATPPSSDDSWKKYGTYYIREIKKPYSQWHIYTSADDIISNKIKATSEGMYTSVTATYLYDSVAGPDKPTTGYRVANADRDIFPQFQKTTIVNSELYSKAPLRLFAKIPVVRQALGAINWIKSVAWSATDNIAFNIAASTVRDYMKDMYQGYLTVIGDPTVKPFDWIYLGDMHNDMYGTCGVKEVTHKISSDTGFVTVIQPDCAVSVEDKDQLSLWNSCGAVGSLATGFLLTKSASASLVQTASSMVGSKLVAAALASEAGGTSAALTAALGTAGLALETGIAGLTLTGVAAMTAVLLPVSIIAFKSVSEIVNRYFNGAQCVTLNLLSYKGKEFSAGINGHRGITVATAAHNQSWQERIKAMLPEWASGEIEGMGPDQIFGAYYDNYKDEQERYQYMLDKYEIPTVKYESNISEEEMRELPKIMSSGNSFAIMAANSLGTPYKENGEGEDGLDSLGLVKFVYKNAGFQINHNSIAELYSDNDFFENPLYVDGRVMPSFSQSTGFGTDINWSTDKEFENTVKVGDIVFFDLNNDNHPSHVGIVVNAAKGLFITSRIDRKNGGGRVELLSWHEKPFDAIYGLKRPLMNKFYEEQGGEGIVE